VVALEGLKAVPTSTAREALGMEEMPTSLHNLIEAGQAG
jgi:hypothetical protein